jgi:hypothetical protein
MRSLQNWGGIVKENMKHESLPKWLDTVSLLKFPLTPTPFFKLLLSNGGVHAPLVLLYFI